MNCSHLINSSSARTLNTHQSSLVSYAWCNLAPLPFAMPSVAKKHLQSNMSCDQSVYSPSNKTLTSYLKNFLILHVMCFYLVIFLQFSLNKFLYFIYSCCSFLQYRCCGFFDIVLTVHGFKNTNDMSLTRTSGFYYYFEIILDLIFGWW